MVQGGTRDLSCDRERRANRRTVANVANRRVPVANRCILADTKYPPPIWIDAMAESESGRVDHLAADRPDRINSADSYASLESARTTTLVVAYDHNGCRYCPPCAAEHPGIDRTRYFYDEHSVPAGGAVTREHADDMAALSHGSRGPVSTCGRCHGTIVPLDLEGGE